ncbi:SDR family oxidoreductase [Rheinheimera sp.]|uniref:SDR family oxidoreductase n=1 Tax=Rheinheimera sp. TaxID=1869214 RepID=UPI00307ED281
MKLQGKTVLLTGASGGIGQAIAQRLAAEGARLILTGRDRALLKTLAQQLPGSAVFFAGDLTDPASQTQLHEFVRSQGGIDVLINNAGISQFGLLAGQQLAALVAVNLLVPMQLCQLFVPMLTARRGAVVNIGSAFGSIGFPGFTGYCATKFGLRGFTEALLRESADSDLEVLYLAPRATRTAINSAEVDALNQAMQQGVDSPELVAQVLVQQLQQGRKRRFIGWPERFLVRLNGLCPAVLDFGLKQKLKQIKHFALNKSQENPR